MLIDALDVQSVCDFQWMFPLLCILLSDGIEANEGMVAQSLIFSTCLPDWVQSLNDIIAK